MGMGFWSVLDALANVVTAAAYFAIPLMLGMLVYRRKDITHAPLFWWFAAFILSCGITHLFHAIEVPSQVLTIAHAVTGVVSLLTAIVFARTFRSLVALPNFGALRRQLAGQDASIATLHSQLNHAQKMEAVGRFAGGVAHDFNNVLTALAGWTKILLDSPRLDPSLTDDVREIQRAADRASQLTKQLMTLGRKRPPTSCAVDLCALVGGTENMLQRLVGEDCVMTVTCAPDVPRVLGDPASFEQVLLNLVVNARDATMGRAKRATIDVTLSTQTSAPVLARHARRYAVLTVADNGEGMTAEVLAHIFDPFFTTKPEGQGTGLGLSTVYSVVQQSGGAVTVRSRVGEGTVFTVHLPEQSVVMDTPLPTAPSVPVPGMGETLLVVEDDPQVANIVERILRGAGYVVHWVNSGDAALAVLAVHPEVQLVLTDIVMPGMSGPELARALRTSHPALRVMFMTGYSGQEQQRRGFQEGEVPFIMKPFTPPDLLARIHEVLHAPL